MKPINIKKLEDCLDGSINFSYSFNIKVGEILMRKLAEGGKLQYFPDFPKPFFKIVTAEGIHIKGIIGDDNFEVLYPRTGRDEKKRDFDARLEKMLD